MSFDEVTYYYWWIEIPPEQVDNRDEVFANYNYKNGYPNLYFGLKNTQFTWNISKGWVL